MGSAYNMERLAEKIKKIRKIKGLSMEAFGEKVGVNKNTIARIEKADKTVSIDTLFKIANTLGTRLDDFLEDKAIENVDFVRTSQNYKEGVRKNRKIISQASSYSIGDTDIHLEGSSTLAGIIEIFPKGNKTPAYHEGEELLFCLTGKILVDINGQEIVLNKGDCVLFWGEQPHSYLSIREDDEQKISVGLSVIVNSRYDSLKNLHQNLKFLSTATVGVPKD